MTATSQLENLRQFLRGKRDYLLEGFGTAPTNAKSQNAWDVVTEKDVGMEKALVAVLADIDPGVKVFGEELGYNPSGAKVFWLIDPIDGTLAYSRGVPVATSMLAKIENGQITQGIIYDFVQDISYYAAKGRGAFANDKKISVSQRPLKAAALFYETRLEDEEEIRRYRGLTNIAWLSSFMGSGYEFASVATGKHDGRVVRAGWGKDWDYAPGVLLVQEAGGTVTNIGARTYTFGNNSFIAANPLVHTELTEGEGALFRI